MLTATAVQGTAATTRRHSAAFHQFYGSADLAGPIMAFDRNAEIYGEGEPADYIYEVVQGAVREYQFSATAGARCGPFMSPATCLPRGRCRIFLLRRNHHRVPGRCGQTQPGRIGHFARWRSRPAPLAIHRDRAGPIAATQPASDQDRARARGRLPAGYRRAARCPKCGRSAHVPPGHCGSSRNDHRDRVPHPHASGGRRGDRASGGTACGASQPLGTAAHDRWPRAIPPSATRGAAVQRSPGWRAARLRRAYCGGLERFR